MPWARFDDDLLTNDKYLGVGVEAKLLWHTSIIYCAKNLTDGFIRSAILPALGRIAGVGDVAPIQAELVGARLWDDCDGGINVHDYLEYNPTKAEVLALREARSEAGARGGKQKASNRLASAKQVLEQMPSKPLAKSYPVPNPVPVPGPVPQDEIRTGANAPAPKARTRKPRMTTPKAETSEPKDERKSALFSAFVRGMRWDASRLSTNDRGQTNYAIKALPDDATPAEIDLAFDIWPGKFKDCAVTPPALAKHFSTLMAEARRKGLGPRIEQPFYAPIDDPPEDPEPLPEPAPVAVNGRVPLEPVDNGWSTYNPHGGYEANRRRANA